MMHTLLALLVAGCSGDRPTQSVQMPTEAAPEPSEPATAAPARSLQFAEPGEQVFAADLDGDGADEMLFAWEGSIYVGTDVLATVEGVLQAACRGDVDGDGDEEAILGFGAGRGARHAPASVWVLHPDRAVQVWSRDGARNQVADLDVVDGRIFMAAFVSSKGVEAGWIEEGAFNTFSTVTMATTQEWLSDGTLLIGRLYGDEPRSEGDLQRHQDGALLETIPTMRGVKSLLAAQLDDDPELEVLVGDGWHYQYGLRAQGHLRLLDGVDLDESRTIALLPDSYSINNIELVRTGDPNSDALLLTGARGVHLLRRDGLGWHDTKLTDLPETGNAVVVYLEDGPWALVSGEPAVLYPLEL